MTIPSWDRLKDLLHHAMQLDAADCERYLEAACGSDAELLAELRSLLAAQCEVPAGFLQSSPFAGSGLAGDLVLPPPLEAGQLFGDRFVLVRQLGEGGMGVVWLADQTAPVRRQVALKLIRAGMYDQQSARRFHAEMQSLAMMDHPAIAKVFDAGATSQGQPYFVMEHVPGRPITDYCDQQRLTIRERLELFIQACDAVQHAHQKAIVHRDLKPGNILVVEIDGKPAPRIIDFGVARTVASESPDGMPYTLAGYFLGTPGYMSPEQADPNVTDVDARADVYALGVMLYVLLSGCQPFESAARDRPSLDRWLRQLREDEPETPSGKLGSDRARLMATARARGTAPEQLVRTLRGDLDWITMKALEKDRTRRYGSAREFAADLRRYLQDQPVSARPAGALHRTFKYVRRHRVGAGVLAGSLAALGVIAFLLTIVAHREGRTPVSERSRVLLTGITNLTGDAEFNTVPSDVLEIDLAQSPFLTLISSRQISKTLQLMERPPDAPLTPALNQEVCLRNRGKAYLAGSIATLGSRYLVTLEANDCQTGERILQSKAEASRKEDVAHALDGLALGLRERLGESLASVRQFDVPVEQATTGSFEALKAYSLGERARLQGDNATAVVLFKHAIEIDATFAMAYAELAAAYGGQREDALARPNFQKAFELRDRTSENEKLLISAGYYQRVGDFVQAVNSYRAWARMYPRDSRPWASLANLYTRMAQYGDAVTAGKEALRLNPDDSRSYIVLARAYKRSNRFAEANGVGQLAIERGLDDWQMHCLLYEVAFATGDTQAMAAQVAREAGKPTEGWMREYEALAAMTGGKVKQARILFEQAIALARTRSSGDDDVVIGGYLIDAIGALAELGLVQEARRLIKRASHVEEIDEAAYTMTEAGDNRRASEIDASTTARYPHSTIVNEQWHPMVQAAIALAQGRPRDALAALEPAAPYALQTFDIPSLRGRAHLAAHDPDAAFAEYSEILRNRGVDAVSPLYPLAYIGLGRALRMQGKVDESRAAYEHLFQFWTESDRDNPMLLRAQAEYASLGHAHR